MRMGFCFGSRRPAVELFPRVRAFRDPARDLDLLDHNVAVPRIDHALQLLLLVTGLEHELAGVRPDPLVGRQRQGHALDAQELLDTLRGQVEDWWLPDEIAQIVSMPLAATGKIDKQQLRADYASGRITARAVVR